MTIDDYKARVIDLFFQGHVTSEHWNEMAAVVLAASETTEHDLVQAIDRAVGATDEHPLSPPLMCHAGKDGDCTWAECPQLRDGEPKETGRWCPLQRPTLEKCC